jgi:HSP20 family molecular chaperone IbpA
MQPLTEVQLTGEEMLVTVEVADASMDSVNLSADGDELTVMYGGEEVVVEEVPDDVRLEDGEANMNNGVLTLNIPRDKAEEGE